MRKIFNSLPVRSIKIKLCIAVAGVENVLPSDTAGQETDTKTVTLFVPKYIAQTGFDPQMNDEIRRLAKEMLDEYEKSYNLDVRLYVYPFDTFHILINFCEHNLLISYVDRAEYNFFANR